MRNYNWENWCSLVEECGCGFLIGLGVLAGAIAWLGWETVLALFLLLLIPVSPWLFARLEPEEELRRRLTALHYATFIALILFFFTSEIFTLPHRYKLLGWTVGLGFWVCVINALVTFFWFRVLRVLATRRLDEGTLTRSTATVTIIVILVTMMSIIGGFVVRPQVQMTRATRETMRIAAIATPRPEELLSIEILSDPAYNEENESIEFTAKLTNEDTRWHIVRIGMQVWVDWVDGKSAVFPESYNYDIQELDIPAKTAQSLRFFYQLGGDEIRPFRITSIEPRVDILSIDDPAKVSAKATATAINEAKARLQQAVSDGKVTITIREILYAADQREWKTGFLMDIANDTCEEFVVKAFFQLIYKTNSGETVLVGETERDDIQIPAAKTTTIPVEINVCYEGEWEGCPSNLWVVGFNPDGIYTAPKPIITTRLEGIGVDTEEVNCPATAEPQQ